MLFSELQCCGLIFFILKDMQSINKYNTNYFVSLYLKRYPWSLLREKCPNSVQISGSNAGKYGPEKLRIWTLFTPCIVTISQVNIGLLNWLHIKANTCDTFYYIYLLLYIL